MSIATYLTNSIKLTLETSRINKIKLILFHYFKINDSNKNIQVSKLLADKKSDARASKSPNGNKDNLSSDKILTYDKEKCYTKDKSLFNSIKIILENGKITKKVFINNSGVSTTVLLN